MGEQYCQVSHFFSSGEDVSLVVGGTSESSCMVGDCLTGLFSESQSEMPVGAENKGPAVRVGAFPLEQTGAQYPLAGTLGCHVYLSKGGTRSKHHLIVNKKDKLCGDLRAESNIM